MTAHPFRFAVLIKNVLGPDDWRATARQVEALGYSTLVMPDHLRPHLAPIPALLAAAEATTTLRVSPFVLANDYRHPVMLAKETATVDVLSGGRLDVALGTGWYEPDYEILGMSLDAPADRVSRLEESVVLLKRLWTEASVDHAGRWYTVRGAEILPRSLQDPHPPLLIGGSGSRMLRLAGREANIVSITGFYRAAEMEERITIIREAAGSRFAEIELNTTVDVVVADDPSPLYEEEAASSGMAVADVEASPSLLYGSLDAIRDQLVANRERFGLSYYAVAQSVMEEFAPLAAEMGSSA